MDLSIVIPCYNEEGCIDEVVTSWIGQISPKISDFEMVVVNDGSTDHTPSILSKLSERLKPLRVVTQKNAGHGAALLHGLREAKGKWVFHVDSDAQFLPEDFWLLWNRRREAPYLLGFRKVRHDPWHRLFVTRCLRLIARILTGCPIYDANIPYKLIEGDLLQRILARIPPNTFAPSILMVVAAHVCERVPIVQTEVRHLPRLTGKTVLHPWRLFKACLESLRQVVAFRLRGSDGR